ncbi:unnamed protein product, partial [Lampetra planeri]
GVKVFKVLVLGEMERGQDEYRTSCFIARLHAREVLSPESVSKLRQRNSAVVRGAGESRPAETLRMELLVALSNATERAARLYSACTDAWDAAYSNADTVRALNRGGGPPVMTILAQLNLPVSPAPSPPPGSPPSFSPPPPSSPPPPPPPSPSPPPSPASPRCRESRSPSAPCVCRCAVCVEWLPCGLRKCKVAQLQQQQQQRLQQQQQQGVGGDREEGSPGGSDVRTCGVRACSKCWTFEFIVPSRNLCLWGDDGA